MTINTINTLSKMLKSAAKRIQVSSDEEFISPEKLAELAMQTVDLSLFDIKDIADELSVKTAKEAQKSITSGIQYHPQMSLPTMDEFEARGISFEGGVVMYKHAQTKHLMHHIESVSDNRNKVNISADRSIKFDLRLIEKRNENPNISTLEAFKMIIDEDDLLADVAE